MELRLTPSLPISGEEEMKGTGVGQRPQRVKWIIINFHDQLCFICSKFVNLQEEVGKKTTTNPTRMDEWKRETNLEVLAFDYLQPPELKARCFCWRRLRRVRNWLTTAVRKSAACCSLWFNRPEPENEGAA